MKELNELADLERDAGQTETPRQLMPTFSSIPAGKKHWVPYEGPADWDLIVLNAPKEELEEGRSEQPEASNG